MQFGLLVHFGFMRWTPDSSAASQSSAQSSAWFTIYSSWSSNSRGFTVWRTPPMPGTPNQATRCRSWFMARVATRSPGCTPIRTSAWARRRESWAISNQLVRCVVPSARAATISRGPCSRSAWSRIRMMRSGNSCIAPSIAISASPSEDAHHGAKTAVFKRLEGELEPGRQWQAALHLLHLARGSGIGLGPGVVDRRRHEVLDHGLFRWLEQALVDVDAEDAALGRRADLDQSAARQAFDLDCVEAILRLLQLGLRVLRHLHDFVEIGEFGHVRRLSLDVFRARNRGTHP